MTDADFFDDVYYRVLEPFHGEEDARVETGALRELLGLALSDRVLDLGCGWGRHLRLLHDAAHEVTGLDRSLPLLRRARVAAPGPGPRAGRPGGARDVMPRLVAGDMLRMPFADGAFDVVLNLATSLGLFADDGPVIAALGEVRRVLRPRGRFLLETMHRADVEANFAHRDAWSLPDGTRVRARRRWDPDRGISYEVLRWQGPRGQGSKRHALRVRTGHEWGRLLREAGLRLVAAYGDWDGRPFRASAPRYIAVARPD